MNRGRPIYWHEGVFLRPQHFQQQDAFHDAKGLALAAMTRPFFWGVRALAVAEGALKDQVLELTELEVLFQDGSLVRYPGNARVAARSFEGLWADTGRPLAVYLALRKLMPDGVNIADDPNGGGGREDRGVRYGISDPDSPTKDLYARDPGQPVLYLEYNLRLLFGQEAEEASDCHLIQVAELERLGSEVRLVGSFVPPVLTVESSPYLLGVFRELKEQLTSRGHELAQYKHGRGLEAPDLGARDLLPLLSLQCLNRWIPWLHQVVQSPRLAPWDGYAALRQIAGELSTFSRRYDVFGSDADAGSGAGLPEYRHTRLRSGFGEARRVISRLLEELAAGPDFVAPLLFDGTYYYADVPERIFRAGSRYYLCVHSPGGADALVGTLQSLAKLSSKEYLPILIARALPGVALEYLAAPPTELPRRPDSIYFALDPHGPAWDPVRDNQNLGVYLETTPGEIEIELMVIYGE